MEKIVIFCKTDIVIFVTLLSQPSIVVGNLGGIGRGWPKEIQSKNEYAVRAPIITPPSVADSVPMPRVKMPINGPPTTPEIVKETYDKRFILFSSVIHC